MTIKGSREGDLYSLPVGDFAPDERGREIRRGYYRMALSQDLSGPRLDGSKRLERRFSRYATNNPCRPNCPNIPYVSRRAVILCSFLQLVWGPMLVLIQLMRHQKSISITSHTNSEPFWVVLRRGYRLCAQAHCLAIWIFYLAECDRYT